ncbi:MAG TPA: hypothetical protein VK745_17795 [Polyangiaceae bacterium]|nr:hypothetical protein [Polyangiaceae bacterium]
MSRKTVAVLLGLALFGTLSARGAAAEPVVRGGCTRHVRPVSCPVYTAPWCLCMSSDPWSCSWQCVGTRSTAVFAGTCKN